MEGSKRNLRVPELLALHLPDGGIVRSLDELQEAVDLMSETSFAKCVRGRYPSLFAQWLDEVFGEPELADEVNRRDDRIGILATIHRWIRIHEG